MASFDDDPSGANQREAKPLDASSLFPEGGNRLWTEGKGSRYRLIIYSLLAITLGPLSLWLLRRFLDEDTFHLPLKAIDPLPLIGALIVLTLAWISRLIRVWYLFRPVARDIGPRDFVRSYLAGVFASQITPSAVGGYPFFLFLLHHQGMSPGSSLAVSLLDSVNTGLAFLLLLLGGALFVRTGIPATRSWLTTAVAGMGILTGAALTPLIFPQGLQQLIHSLSQKRSGLGSKLAPLADKAFRELQRLEWVTTEFWNHHRRLLILNLLLNVVYWTAYLAVTPLLFLAVGGKGPWPVVIGGQIATQFAQYFIPTPGAAGGAEVTMAVLMHTLLPEERLILFLGLWRFFTYYISLIGSSLTIPWTLRVLRQRTQDSEGDVPTPPELPPEPSEV